MLNIKYYCNDLTTKQDYSYQLFAILIYMNTDQKQQLGHYIVYIHNLEKDKWYEYDDSKVTQLDSINNVKKLCCNANISGLFYINESIYRNFSKNKKSYDDARNLFCATNYINEIDINDNLSVNDQYDQYRSYSSTTSDIDSSQEDG